MDIRALGDKVKIPEVFEFQVWYVVEDEAYAITLERFLTIYYNRANNSVGYDLSINNYYNPIVGDLVPTMEGELHGTLNPVWLDIPSSKLADAVKKDPTMDSIEIRFNASSGTIRGRFITYGFAIKGIKGLTGARAYFLKPLIEEAVKKDLTIHQCIQMCLDKGVTFFKDFSYKEDMFNEFCEYIWHDEFESYGLYNDIIKSVTYPRVRKLIITKETLKIMKNPLINSLKKAIRALAKRGVKIRRVTELSDILKWTIGERYSQRQEKVLKPMFVKYLKQISPVLSLKDILIKFNIPPTSDNLEVIRHKISSLFQKGVRALRKDLWQNEPIFKLFGSKADKLINYITKSMHILRGLFELLRINSSFTSPSLSNVLGLHIKAIHYQIDTNLIPLGLVEFKGWRTAKGRGNEYKYKEYEFTDLGKRLLEKLFF